MKYFHNNVEVMRGSGVSLEQLAADLNVPVSELSTIAETGAEKSEERSAAKLNGIDFNGTMISATGDDQAGLVAVWSEFKGYQLNKNLILPSALASASDEEKPAIQAKIDALAFPAVYFTFDNGSKLVIDADNIEALESVWKPFRMSFFPVPG